MDSTPETIFTSSPRHPRAKDDADLEESWLKRNGWPAFFLVLIVVTGMSFSLFWNPLFYHSPYWVTPADLWNTFRASQYVIWGGEGQIYNNPAAFQTFPGIAILLSPVAKVAGMLHLSESFAMSLPRPSTWWLLGPVQLALGASLLFPLDKLARRFHVSSRQRIVLLALEATLIWPSVALWGHPEDALGVALALYGLLAVVERRWLRFAVYFGLATLMQPLVLLVFPICLAFVPMRRWVPVSSAIALPSVVALFAPLVQEWGPTSRLLLRQPNYLMNNHPTPWVALAPVIDPERTTVVNTLKSVRLPSGHHRLIEVAEKVHTLPIVAAGPGRIVAIVIACALGFAVKRLAPTLPQVVWFASLSLSLRCAFEPVMVPYYLLPGLALALLVASATSKARFAVVAVAAGVCAYLSYWHLSEWRYYLVVVVPLAVALYVAWPARPSPQRATLTT